MGTWEDDWWVQKRGWNMDLKLLNNTLSIQRDGSIWPLVQDWGQLVQRLMLDECQCFEEEMGLLKGRCHKTTGQKDVWNPDVQVVSTVDITECWNETVSLDPLTCLSLQASWILMTKMPMTCGSALNLWNPRLSRCLCLPFTHHMENVVSFHGPVKSGHCFVIHWRRYQLSYFLFTYVFRFF